MGILKIKSDDEAITSELWKEIFSQKVKSIGQARNSRKREFLVFGF
jgi:hypothetical protein